MRESAPHISMPRITAGVISAVSRAPARAKQNIRQQPEKANAESIEGIRLLRNWFKADSYSEVK
jgi:hypothetical protein